MRTVIARIFDYSIDGVIAAKVPAGRDGCAGGLTAKLIQWNPSADITVTVESWAPGMDACPLSRSKRPT